MAGSQVESLQELTRHVCDVNLADNNGFSPLHIYAMKTGDKENIEKDLETVKLLLTAGADVNAKDNNGKTPLYLAVKADRSKEIVEALIDGGADLELIYKNDDEIKGTILFHSVIPKEITPAKELSYDFPLEKLIFKYMDAEITKMLIEKGARIDNGDKMTPGYSPLLAATLFCRTELVNHMLKDVSISTENKNKTKEVNLDQVMPDYPIFCKFNHKNEKKRCPVDCHWNASHWTGFTALHLSIFHSNMEMVTALIKAGANPNIKDKNEFTILHKAIRGGKHNIVKLLVKGCDENCEEANQK